MYDAAKATREWRQRNPDWVRDVNHRNVIKRRGRIDLIKMESGCVDCGYAAHPAALHFDHVRGEKKFNISTKRTGSMEMLLEEIAKCEVVCANCHALRTASRRDGTAD